MANGGARGLTASWLDYGATLQSLMDHQGRALTISLSNEDAYRQPHPYIGSTVGRVANRIRGGRFQIQDRDYQVTTTENGHALHSGPDGFDRQVWERSQRGDALIFRHISPDGHQGYPGTLDVTLSIEMTPTSLTQTFTATTDKATPVSLTNHSYFRLPGMKSVNDLELQIYADSYTDVDSTNLPTDYEVPLFDSDTDFREPETISTRLIDHSFNIRGSGLRPHARIRFQDMSLTVHSTLPAVQIFTGEALSQVGLPSRAGLAIEPQFPPNLINSDRADEIILRPDQTYRHTIRYEVDGG